MTDLTDRLTVLVLTYNRYPRLRRLLRYVQATGLRCAIRVLDSSTDPIPDGVARLLAEAPIEHRRYDPAIHPIAKQAHAAAEVTTPYTVLWCDDDLLVPRGLQAAVEWLENFPEYSAATGRAVLFVTHEGHDRPPCLPYTQRPLEQPTATDRLLDHFSGATVLNYAVHRTANLRRNLQICEAHALHFNWAELLLSALDAIQGLVKQMDRLYFLKEAHAANEAWADRVDDRAFGRAEDLAWIFEPGSATKARAFLDELAQSLAAADALPIARARQIVSLGFDEYLCRTLFDEQGKLERAIWPERPSWRARALRGPMLAPVWRAIRPLVQRRRPFTREALSADKRYRADFATAYQIILEESRPAPASTAGSHAPQEQAAAATRSA